MHVLVLVGSLRAGSTNARLADVAIGALPVDNTVTRWERLTELPFYSEDLDTDAAPAIVGEFRDVVAAADALLVVTPEYNGSLPAILKNAIDWASRPRGAAAIAGLPAAVLAASGSPRAALWAREDAVKVLRVAGALPLAETVGIGSAWSAFEGGRLVDPTQEHAVHELMGALVAAARVHVTA